MEKERREGFRFRFFVPVSKVNRERGKRRKKWRGGRRGGPNESRLLMVPVAGGRPCRAGNRIIGRFVSSRTIKSALAMTLDDSNLPPRRVVGRKVLASAPSFSRGKKNGNGIPSPPFASLSSREIARTRVVSTRGGGRDSSKPRSIASAGKQTGFFVRVKHARGFARFPAIAYILEKQGSRGGGGGGKSSVSETDKEDERKRERERESTG